MSVASHPALTPYRRNYTPAPAPVSIFTNPDRGPRAPADAPRSPPPRAGERSEERTPAADPAVPFPTPPGQGLTLAANDPAAIQAARERGARRGLNALSSHYAMARMRPAANAAANLARGRGRKANSPGGLAITHLRKTGAAMTVDEIIAALDLPGERIPRNALSAYLASYVQRGHLGRYLDAKRRARYCDLAAAPAVLAAAGLATPAPEARP